ncbi:MAG: GNAT family N-acetyltransferase [Lachnospiraceae bacterium]|jgi:hypothetical protein|nr:GNAT family N-acetyltransferase [Lachnospiraceae bacterium]
MSVRKLEPKEHANTRFLYEQCFPEDSSKFIDYYYSEKILDNQIYVLEEDGQFCSMLHLNPYKLVVNGDESLVDYVVAVATDIKHRKKGYMRQVLTTALNDMFKDGKTFAFLMPARESIYIPYSFLTVCRQETKRIIIENQGYLMEPGTEEMKVPEGDEFELLAETANCYLYNNYKVFVKRDGNYYRRLLKELKSDGAGIFIGIANKYDRKGILLCNCITDYRIILPMGEPYPQNAKIMFRILNVKQALSFISFKERCCICFSVSDPDIEENNAIFHVIGSDITDTDIRLNDKRDYESVMGTLPVYVLCGLIFGALTPGMCYNLKGVTMSIQLEKELDKWIPIKPIYISEMV